MIEWDFDTNFIKKNQTELINIPIQVKNEDVLTTVICYILNNQQSYKQNYQSGNPWFALDNFRVNYSSTNNYKLMSKVKNEEDSNHVINVDLKYLNDHTFSVEIEIKGEKVKYKEIAAKFLGDNKVEINIVGDTILKAEVCIIINLIIKYYLDEEDNIKIVKSDGSETNLVRISLITQRNL